MSVRDGRARERARVSSTSKRRERGKSVRCVCKKKHERRRELLPHLVSSGRRATRSDEQKKLCATSAYKKCRRCARMRTKTRLSSVPRAHFLNCCVMPPRVCSKKRVNERPKTQKLLDCRHFGSRSRLQTRSAVSRNVEKQNERRKC